MAQGYRLRTVLFVAFLFVVAIPLTFLSYFHSVAYDRDQRRVAGNRLQEAAQGIAASVDDYIGRHRAAVGNVAGTLEASGRFNQSTLHATLQRTRAHHEGFLTMIVADERGTIVAADPPGPASGPTVIGNSIADRPYFQEAIRQQRPYVSNAFLGRGFGNDPIVAVSRAFRGPGGRLYVLEGSLDLAKFRMFESRYATIEQSPIIIADGAHRVVYASPMLNEPPLKDITNAPITQRGHEHQDHFFELPQDTGNLLVAHTTTGFAGWHVYISQPIAVVERLQAAYLRVTVLVAGFALLAALLLAQWVSVTVSRPVERLEGSLQHFFESGTVEPVRLPRLAPQEIGSLAAAYEQMSARLTKVLTGLLPICAWCRKIRDDRGDWQPLEAYISRETDARPTHGMCPECAQKHFPEEAKRILKDVT